MKSSTSFGQPGGNPTNKGGRPKGLAKILRAELDAVRERMETSFEKSPDGKLPTEIMDGYRAVFRRLWSIIIRGDDKDSIAAIKLLLERTDGKPREYLEVTGASPEQAAALEALRMTPEERRKLAASDETEDQAALEQATDADADAE
ncbi:MAG TPA: hypothetical protein VM764_04400 [Gemmatimonadaceae bacterium]|nr:hypothetical protein [Gemmatimonadaceae bacterium]